MKLYLAAPWKDRASIAEIAGKLEAQGHSITKKWWEVEDVPEGTAKAPEVLRQQAQDDMDGVVRADLVLVINTAKSEGKATEQGIALALNKPILIVGKRGEFSANVFHYMLNYNWVETVDEALKVLGTIKWLLREAQ